jgi:hypothetical protein
MHGHMNVKEGNTGLILSSTEVVDSVLCCSQELDQGSGRLRSRYIGRHRTVLNFVLV